MKERPILFSGEMVRAILEDRKIQTRRVVKLTYPHWEVARPANTSAVPTYMFQSRGARGFEAVNCPYGTVGDVLWVRETMWRNGGYVATQNANFPNEGKVPAIHMPKHACRLRLEITGICAERLQDISDADALAEGCGSSRTYVHSRTAFMYLWERINGEGSWDANPWVWVVEFKKL